MAPRTALRSLLLTVALMSGSCRAAQEDLRSLFEKLNERIDRLEKRNAELEREVAARRTPEIEKRVKALEESQASVEKGLDSDGISQYEPELTSRLKAVEKDALEAKKASRKFGVLDGIKTGVSLVTVAQKPFGLPEGTADGNSQLNYRADITIGLPLDPIGTVDQRLFGHFRIGQGTGLNAPFSRLGAFASAPNAAAFRASGANPDDSVAILGQAWYQATIPLPYGGFKPHSKQNLEVTFGKMDIFGFFDQNAIAGDESRQFLNSVFVHSPLLDAGGQIGVDANGFQPGFILAYNNKAQKSAPWRLSVGAFGTGSRGANYQRTFSSPLLMAQAEISRPMFNGLGGSYRLYMWRQGQGHELDGTLSHQSGWGISIDQKVTDSATLFGRYAHMIQGNVRFDGALTLGVEYNGSDWGRGADAIGFAAGWLGASREFRSAGGSGDIDGDGIADFNYSPGSAEQVAELYYRYRLAKQFELTPDFQYVNSMGANPGARAAKILGLRAQLAF